MYKNFRAIIFDLDGTLIDSMWIWREIDIEYLSRRGIELPVDLQNEIEGLSFTETAKYFKDRFDINDAIQEIKDEWRDIAKDYYENHIVLKEGAEDFVRTIKQQNIKLGIGTSNTRELTEQILRRHNITNLFDVVVTSCEVEHGKPSPDVFLRVAQLLAVAPEQCLVFEDTYSGVLAAKRAGMKVIAVEDEISLPNKQEIIKLADRYIETFNEINALA